jgi:hypothetical protein
MPVLRIGPTINSGCLELFLAREAQLAEAERLVGVPSVTETEFHVDSLVVTLALGVFQVQHHAFSLFDHVL